MDRAAGHRPLNFLDAYYGYNQICIHPRGVEKIAFIIESVNYCYQVFPFGQKNVGATYQRLMDKIFKNQIGRNMKVYVNDMVVKSNEVESHVKDLAEIFLQIRKHNMRLNPEKCVFEVR